MTDHHLTHYQTPQADNMVRPYDPDQGDQIVIPAMLTSDLARQHQYVFQIASRRADERGIRQVARIRASKLFNGLNYWVIQDR